MTIAIVGMACRFPQAADPSAFWRLLVDKVDVTRDFPAERWDVAGFYDPDPAAPGKSITRRGGFLEGVDRFDPLFFGISPREAQELDPQQRLALELSWEALEDAGLPAPALRGSRTGVFLASMWHDWGDLSHAHVEGMSSHRATGQSMNLIANRVSYVLGLRGPSAMLDTGCSSALVAMQFACRSLTCGDATLALAGGVNLLLTPEVFVALSKFGGLSPDGRCKAFDARGDGFGRGEGGAVVVLKPLANALRDGDRVLAIVRGTEVNNDGTSNGLTTPSGEAQADMLVQAYARAGVAPASVHFVEAHGTGTFVGDPIEARALGEVLGSGAGRPPERPLIVGSAKTNLAHTEAAAGIAGVVKTVLAMRERVIPPNLHFETPNPRIPFEELALRIPRTAEPWPAPDDAPALAGVSSFGWGGTNSHVVLEGPPAAPRWLGLAAASADELRAGARALADAPAGARGAGPFRLSLTARSRRELDAKLDAFARGEAPIAQAPAGVRPRVVFHCAPSGSPGAARELLTSEPVFRAALERCDAAFRPLTGQSLLAQVLDGEPVDAALLFAVQLGLAELWRSWGVAPDAVVGQGAGEVAAAVIAGALPLAEAAAVAHGRAPLPAWTAAATGAGDLVIELGAAPDLIGLLERRAELWALGVPERGPAAEADLLVFSARTPEALRARARSLADWLEARPDVDPRDVCFTAAARRTHHEERGAVVGRSREELITELRAWTPGRPSAAKVVFVFPGQGSQWLGMGRELAAREPVFRQALEACEAAMRPYVDWSLAGELAAGEASSRLGENDVVQPVLWAIYVALAALWRSWGIEPAAVVGHSMGEAAAAVVAGALSLEDAARVITLRSRIARRHASGKGAMAVVELSFADAERELAGLEDRLAVGVANGPRTSVLSGDPAALETVLERLRARAVFCRVVKVDYASHSPQMDPLRPMLLEALAATAPRATTVPFFSTVTGDWIDGTRLDAAYWAANLRQPVRFAQAVAALRAQGLDTFVEVSPHPVLVPSIEDGGAVALASLRRNQDERECLLRSLAALYARGATPAVERLWPAGGRVVPLPGYPFQRERYWLDLAPRRSRRAKASGEHPLLGAPFATPAQPGLRLWQGAIDVAALPYLADHRVGDAVVVPAAAFLEMALAAAPGRALERVELHDALVLADGEPATVQLALSEGTLRAWRLTGADAGDPESFTPWASCALAEAGAPPASEAPAELERRLGGTAIPGDELYARLAAAGLRYGPSFRGLERVVAAGGEALGRVRARSDAAYALHPALLDAALHVALAAAPPGKPLVPVRIERMALHARPEGPCWSHARLRADGLADVRLLDDGGRVLVEVLGVELSPLEADTVLCVEWQPAPARAPAPARPGRWLLVADEAGVAAELQALLRARGQEAELLPDELDGAPCRGVVYLRALDAASDPAADVDRALEASVLGALRLVQGLARAPWRDAPRLWLVTRGALAGAALQAPLLGLGQTLAYEHPELAATRLDLGPDHGAAEIVAELLADPPEDQIALRPEGRVAPRLVRRVAPRRAAPVVPPGASYLVTGGLGALGLELARWLVARGARHLVLAGRGGATTEAQQQALAALTEAGARVEVARLDVADRAQVSDLVAGLPALRGVFHAAGVLDDALLAQQTAERFRRVLRPKVHGAWNLHLATRGLALDWFVLYSSVASLVGSPGQGNYSAANAFLDGLAHLRRAQGLPALSINWGVFAEVGLGAANAGRLAERGMAPLDLERAHRVLGRLLGGELAQVGVASFDARQWLEFYPALAAAPLFAGLMESARPPEGAGLRAQVLAAAPADRAGLVEEAIRAQVTRVMRVDAARVQSGTSLATLGLDSLTGMELRNRLEVELGEVLPTTLLWTYPRVGALAAHLVALVAPEAKPAPAPDPEPAAPVDNLAAALSAMSDEALLAELASELGEDR